MTMLVFMVKVELNEPTNSTRALYVTNALTSKRNNEKILKNEEIAVKRHWPALKYMAPFFRNAEMKRNIRASG